jgi:hypothetical protein
VVDVMLSAEIQVPGSHVTDQSYGLAGPMHDNVDHARDRILAIVKSTGISVTADAPHGGRFCALPEAVAQVAFTL